MAGACCGAPNVPLPPSLHLPAPVSDLRAVRKGERVYLAWTSPEHTTDHQMIRAATTVQICRSGPVTDAAPMKDCGVPVGTLAILAPAESDKKADRAAKVQENYSDALPPQALQSDPAAKLTYAISVLNDRGRSAGISNQVSVSAVHTLPPPSGFQASVTSDGVLLAWNPAPDLSPDLQCFYRVYRASDSAEAVIAGEVPISASSLLDKNFEWEKHYAYRAMTVSGPLGGDAALQVEGDDTPNVAVFTHDIFAPAPPIGLQAVFTQSPTQAFVDLVWTPNGEPDLAGYNVYRHNPTGGSEKINSDLVKVPAYRDEQIVSGAQYYYAVTGVDLRGNESALSDEAHERVP